MNTVSGEQLNGFYQVLLKAYGHQGWWPAKSPFETMIGAILAQNVSWTGAHKAVTALKEAGMLSVSGLAAADTDQIAVLIRSSRYYNQKAERIKTFIDWFIREYNGNIPNMACRPIFELRDELLALKGFGPETVDSILLYACNMPVFVVDAYTRRIGDRQGWFSGTVPYAVMQNFFVSRLPPNTALFNDLHAQIVHLGNQVCRKKPDCSHCPVRDIRSVSRCAYPARIRVHGEGV